MTRQHMRLSLWSRRLQVVLERWAHKDRLGQLELLALKDLQEQQGRKDHRGRWD